MATKRGTKAPPAAAAAAADQDYLDPTVEWHDSATNYALRLNLSGFKKEDFRVQLDGTGRLTVYGQRPAGADGKIVRLHKVFQLPSTANLDEIRGRFDGNVLTITVPKRPGTAPTTIDEIKKPNEDTQPPMPKEDDAEANKTTDTKPPKEDGEPKEEEIPKKAALDEASEKQQQEAAAATSKRRKQEQEQKPTPTMREEEVMKPKAEAAARPTEKLAFDRGLRLAERAKAAAADKEVEPEKSTTLRGRWKEQVVGGLGQLADLKWADGLVEAARKEEVIAAVAAAAAAFSLGFFVSQKLLSRK